jgi:hypothetical protein
MRSRIARFAMRRRGTVAAALILVLALAGTAIAGTGRGADLELGVVNTINNYLTTLRGSFTGPMLQVTNTGTGRGIGITVAAGKAPIVVNSSAGKAINLNADKLDGKNSSFFLPATGKAANADKLDGVDSSGFLGSSVVIETKRTTGVNAGSFYYDYLTCTSGTLVSGGFLIGNATFSDVGTSVVKGDFPSYGYYAVYWTGPGTDQIEIYVNCATTGSGAASAPSSAAKVAPKPAFSGR